MPSICDRSSVAEQLIPNQQRAFDSSRSFQMKEHPILFSAPMVRAILSGTKAQTRRVVALKEFGPTDTPGYDWHFRDRSLRWHDVSTQRLLDSRCPYGRVGDRLWLRETWCPLNAGFGPLRRRVRIAAIPGARTHLRISYRADHTDPAGDADRLEWRPSIHMPRWASRITLEITDVRVQRVQDISYDDALAEGVPMPVGGKAAARDAFYNLWTAINSKRSPEYCWSANPWVWAISFRRVETRAPHTQTPLCRGYDRRSRTHPRRARTAAR